MLDTKTLAVITAAVDAYIESENNDERRFGQKMSPWKMAGRRETMSKRALAGGNRGSIHQKIGESLADLCLVIKPILIVLDAVRILTANGPQGGDLKDVKKIDTVIAGGNQVAVILTALLFSACRAPICHT